MQSETPQTPPPATMQIFWCPRGPHKFATETPLPERNQRSGTLQCPYDGQAIAIGDNALQPTVTTSVSAPAAPASLAATASAGVIQLSWTASIGATSYSVYRGTTSGEEGAAPLATIGTANAVQALDVVDSGGSGNFTIAVEGTVTGNIVYSAVAATLVNNIQAALNTTFGASAIVCSGSTLAGITLTFSGASFANRPVGLVTVTPGTLTGATFTPSITTPGPVAKGAAATGTGEAVVFTDTTVNAGTTYYYTVKSTNATGASAASPEAFAAAVWELSAQAVGSTIVLAWEPFAGASGHVVYRGTASGSEAAYMTVGVASSFTDKSVTNGTTYYYFVKAKIGPGLSGQSAEASALAA